MIFKSYDSKKESLSTLKKLLTQSNSNKQKALINQDLQLLKNGIESEKQNGYYIDFYLSDSKHLIVLHDIRLEYNGHSAQIDHMLISRFGIDLLESKSFKGILTINSDSSLDVNYNGKVKSYPNPLEQSKRHAELLRKFIDDNFDLGKRIKILGGIEIDNVVLIHPETTITNKTLPDGFVRADSYISQRREDIDKISSIQALKLVSKMITIESVKSLAATIFAAHKPIKFDYTKKYKISTIKTIDIDTQTKEMTQPSVNKIVPDEIKEEKSKNLQLVSGDPCPFCKNPLVLRKGKNNIPFLGCSSFPKCRFSRSISAENIKKIGVVT